MTPLEITAEVVAWAANGQGDSAYAQIANGIKMLMSKQQWIAEINRKMDELQTQHNKRMEELQNEITKAQKDCSHPFKRHHERQGDDMDYWDECLICGKTL